MEIHACSGFARPGFRVSLYSVDGLLLPGLSKRLDFRKIDQDK
jgi:hypothetical protein